MVEPKEQLNLFIKNQEADMAEHKFDFTYSSSLGQII